MDWLESIKEIRETQKNDRLVIFVGSGVSKNSSIPTWGELVKKIALKLNYNEKCADCAGKDGNCPKIDCDVRFHFDQAEFLRIPEYFCDKFGSDEYNNIIKETLGGEHEPNAIDELILDILPSHIITTNYDKLLENAKSVNTIAYKVVSRDKDILEKSDNRFIIKMHGDIDDCKNIVLKESDYSYYEQNHVMISTYIKSLLINHNFLFVGYSLNDSNLNLIIGWINYFCKINGVESRPKNYLILNKPVSEYEYKRLQNSNVFAIDLHDEIEKNITVPPELTDPIGRKLYCYLKCIADNNVYLQFVPLEEILLDRCISLKAYNKISYEDLIPDNVLGRYEVQQNSLVIYDKNIFNSITRILTDNKIILDAFERAGFERILCGSEEMQCYNLDSNFFDDCFQFYLDNDYVKIMEECYNNLSSAAKLYYAKLIGNIRQEEIDALIEADAQEINKNDYIGLLLHKTRSRQACLTLLDRQKTRTEELNRLFETADIYNRPINFLKKIFYSPTEEIIEMTEILCKQQNKYKYDSSTVVSGHPHSFIWKLQAYVYDYYYFCIKNYLPVNYFSDVKKYFSMYMEAILCTYSPIKQNGSLFSYRGLMPYVINEVDLDMFIKYVEHEMLKKWLKEYNVTTIEIDDKINITKKFKNYCNTFVVYYKENLNNQWIQQLKNFILLICHIELKKEEKEEIFSCFVQMVSELKRVNNNYLVNIFECINLFVKNFIVDTMAQEKAILIDCLVDNDVYNAVSIRYKRLLDAVLTHLHEFISMTTLKLIKNSIDNESDEKKKIIRIYNMRMFLDMKDYKDCLEQNYNNLGYRRLFDLIFEKRIDYNEQMFSVFENVIIEQINQRKPGTQTIPDYLNWCIEDCIVLYLAGYGFNVSKLMPYKNYSVYLEFISNPEGFDYTLVDIKNYMWQNFIYSNEYRQYFIEHRDEILNGQVENIFSMDLASKAEQKIVYGVLLKDEKELYNFGK